MLTRFTVRKVGGGNPSGGDRIGNRLPVWTTVFVTVFCVAHASARQPAAGGAAGAGPNAPDAFADELNPFGGRRSPADGASGKSDSDQPPAAGDRPRTRPRMPVPFPEAESEPAATVRRAGPQAGPSGRARPAVVQEPPFPGADDAAPGDNAAPSPAEPLLVQAEALEQRGDLKGARDTLRAAVAADPRLPVSYLALGMVLRRLGDHEAAVDVFSRGIEIDPLDPELRLRRGITWFHQGIYGIALEDFEDASGLAYEDPRPELWRGLTLMELGRTLEAINAYAASIRRDRGFRLGYLNRGLAYLALDEPRRAEFDFDLVIRADPHDVEAWFSRGVAQARQGHYRDAVNSYSEALERDPTHAPSRRNLAAVRRLAGR